MPNYCLKILLVIAVIICDLIDVNGQSQASLVPKDSSITLSSKQIEHYTSSIDQKAASISKQVEKANTKALRDLQQQEQKLQKKLAKADSNLAKQLFEPAKQQLANLNSKVTQQKSKLGKLKRFGSIGELYNQPQTSWQQIALLGTYEENTHYQKEKYQGTDIIRFFKQTKPCSLTTNFV
jgi:Skp family chaperone for outer membrane proteins